MSVRSVLLMKILYFAPIKSTVTAQLAALLQIAVVNRVQQAGIGLLLMGLPREHIAL